MRNNRSVSFLAATLILAIAVFTPAASNLWRLASGRGFVIPTESSVFTFHVIQMNPGSGEWWLYGEDRNNYYHFTGNGQPGYRLIARHEARRCPGFDKTDIDTWNCARPPASPAPPPDHP